MAPTASATGSLAFREQDLHTRSGRSTQQFGALVESISHATSQECSPAETSAGSCSRMHATSSKSSGAANAYPLPERARISTPAPRNAWMRFHTAARVSPKSRASAVPPHGAWARRTSISRSFMDMLGTVLNRDSLARGTEVEAFIGHDATRL